VLADFYTSAPGLHSSENSSLSLLLLLLLLLLGLLIGLLLLGLRAVLLHPAGLLGPHLLCSPLLLGQLLQGASLQKLISQKQKNVKDFLAVILKGLSAQTREDPLVWSLDRPGFDFLPLLHV
jgi:hypothetical protein